MVEDQDRLELVDVLTQVERGMTRRLAAALKPDDVGVEEWRALSALAESAGQAMSELAEFVLVPPPTLTKLVDRLVSENLVYRRIDPADRRRVLVSLTPRGRRLHRRLRRVVEATLSPVYGDSEAAELTQRLGEIARRLQQDSSSPPQS
jgi:DNA-binding MarR family transcriptional regulator